ncbi:MAG: hypothetical protein JXQ75_00800 [Phycisphaerae bacterium]|nr:hypothetical protein [Phycisphaerae bacterium]
MWLNRDHRAFDEAIEILCMLPQWPYVSFLADLCQDMGYRKQGEVLAKLEELKARGFNVGLSVGRTFDVDGCSGRAAWIGSTGSTVSRLTARTYFDEVYAVCGGS